MTLEQMIASGQAMQDREVAEGVAWFEGSDRRMVMEFYTSLNEADGPELRGLSAGELNVVRSLALIGMFEVIRSWAARQAEKGGVA
jgi:hypothetical protein